MFTFVAFVLAVVGQEFWRGASARRDDDRRAAAARARAAGRAATGAATAATWCTPGSPSCSWAWPPRRRSSSSATCGCARATRSRWAATRSPTCGATARLGGDARRHRRADLARGGAGRAPRATSATRCARRATTTRPRTRRKGVISRFFEGEATSEVDVRWGLRKRLLAGGAARPRLRSSRRSARATASSPTRPADVQAIVIAALAERYRQQPAAGGVPGDRVAAGGLDLDRRRHRRARRARGALALARGAAAPRAQPLRGPARAASCRAPSCRWSTRSRCWSWRRSSPSSCSSRCAGREAEERRDEAASRSSRPPRRPSTARSATPSSTTGWASSRRRTGAALDRELRGEAIEILRQLDRLEGRPPATPA